MNAVTYLPLQPTSNVDVDAWELESGTQTVSPAPTQDAYVPARSADCGRFMGSLVARTLAGGATSLGLGLALGLPGSALGVVALRGLDSFDGYSLFTPEATALYWTLYRDVTRGCVVAGALAGGVSTLFSPSVRVSVGLASWGQLPPHLLLGVVGGAAGLGVGAVGSRVGQWLVAASHETVVPAGCLLGTLTGFGLGWAAPRFPTFAWMNQPPYNVPVAAVAPEPGAALSPE